MSTASKWLAGLSGLLGLWLVAVPFVLGVPMTATWNATVVGGIIAVFGGYNYYLAAQGRSVNVSVAAVNVLLGLWVIAAPFIFQPGMTALWNDLIVGGLVALFSGYNAYDANRASESADQPVETRA